MLFMYVLRCGMYVMQACVIVCVVVVICIVCGYVYVFSVCTYQLCWVVVNMYIVLLCY